MKRRSVGYFVVLSDPGVSKPDWEPLSDVMAGVLNFWRETTGGYLKIEPTELKSVQISIPQIDPTNEQIRDAITASAQAAAAPGTDPLSPFDVLFAIVYPGTFTYTNPDFDPGNPASPPTVNRIFRAQAFPRPYGQWIGLVSTGDTHATFCHELGHCFFFNHPYGLITGADDDPATTTIEESSEYGSPYDIMGIWAQNSVASSAHAWRYTSSFVDAAVPGWPGVVFRSQCGPNLSRAQLHRLWPDALYAEIRPRPIASSPFSTLITAPKTADPWNPSAGNVLVLQEPNEPQDKAGRIYVEYRTAEGWDRGLATAPGDAAREGIVIHEVARTPSDGTQLWFRGAVWRDSPDADFHLVGAGLTFTVQNWTDDAAQVEVSVVTTPSLRVDIVAEVATRTHALDVEEQTTPCGDTYLQGLWETSLRKVYAARVTGFGGGGEFTDDPVRIEWAIDGVKLDKTVGNVTIVSGGRSYAVSYAIDQQTFRLTATTGSGDAYSVEVTAHVLNRPDVGGRALLDPEGRYEGIEPRGLAALIHCIEQNIPIPADWFTFKRPPNPLSTELINPQLEAKREVWGQERLNLLNQMATIDESVTAALTKLVKAQLPGP